MAVVSALIFLSAVALIAIVVAATLVPALPKIRAALIGMSPVEARLVTVSRRRVSRAHPATARLAQRMREAA